MTLRRPDENNPGGPDRVEELLTEHLTAVLEPQRGRALKAFRTHVEEKQAVVGTLKPARAPTRTTQISRKELWFWTGVPTLAAACLAVVVTLFVMKNQTGTPIEPQSIGGGTIVVNQPRQVDHVVVTQRATGGVVVSHNQPMQEVRERTLDQYQWIDPKDNATYRLVQPKDSLQYIQIKPD